MLDNLKFKKKKISCIFQQIFLLIENNAPSLSPIEREVRVNSQNKKYKPRRVKQNLFYNDDINKTLRE